MPTPLLEKITANLKKALHPGARLVLAISGGSDSTCLLNLLIPLQSRLKFQLILAHFNHQIRDRSSDQDQKFVAKLAKKHHLPLFTEKQDVPAYARQRKLNLEEAARLLRYQFLEKIRQQEKADFILTAHHFNDNLETVILNLLRGCSLNGLAGIPLKSGHLLRPLYNIPKNEIETYLKKNKIRYRLDKTNLDPRLKRNFVRLKLIPLLEKCEPDFLVTARRNLKTFQTLNQFFTEKALEWMRQNKLTKRQLTWKFPITTLLKEPNFLQLEILRHLYLKRYGHAHNLTQKHLLEWQKLLTKKQTGKFKNFGPDFKLQINYGKTVISRKISPAKRSNQPISLPIPGQIHFQNYQIQTRLLQKPPKNLKNSSIFLDYSSNNSNRKPTPLSLRRWKKGDHFQPLGLKGSQKLQDFFTNRKISRLQRSQIPLFLNSQKEILAVGPLAIHEKYKVTPRSKRILQIDILKK